MQVWGGNGLGSLGTWPSPCPKEGIAPDRLLWPWGILLPVYSGDLSVSLIHIIKCDLFLGKVMTGEGPYGLMSGKLRGIPATHSHSEGKAFKFSIMSKWQLLPRIVIKRQKDVATGLTHGRGG